MKTRLSQFVILTLFLFLATSLCALTSSQTSSPTLTVALNSPADGSTLTSFDCNFTYTSTLLGNTSLSGAKLIINGTETINQPYPQNSTINRIAVVFSANGTYIWNIKVQDNTTTTATAASNFTVTIAVPSTPAPTLLVTASPSPTAAPTSTVTLEPTTTPTVSPSPSPMPKPTDQPIGIDGSSILLISLAVLAVVFAFIIVVLRKASR
jgi:hypothetical protein